MKKIAIITAYYKNYNYGGLLQAYALQTVLNKLGAKAETLSYKANGGWKIYLKNLIAILKSNILKPLGWKIIVELIVAYLKYPFQTSFMNEYTDELEKRKKLFDEFMEKDIVHSEVYDHNTVKQCVDYYDCFITGSDQVFHPSKYDDSYFLAFVPDEKPKYSYAASVGKSFLSKKEIEYMKKYLERFQGISVREDSAKKTFDSVMEKDIKVLLDPTLLLDKDEWCCKEREVQIGTPYMLVYLLGSRKENFELIQKCADILHLPIVYLPSPGKTYGREDKMFGDIHLFDAGPKEFLYLIHNADFICTDSFHGTVFSVLYEKQFLAFKRNKDSDKRSMNDRIYTLLKQLKLSDRIASANSINYQVVEKIHFEEVKECLNKIRKNSVEYLENIVR